MRLAQTGVRAFAHAVTFMLCVAVTVPVFGELSFSVDDSAFIVMSGSNDKTLGALFDSRSGSLLPGPTGESGPFQFVLSNSASTVGYGSLGVPVTVDGSITLPVRWNPLGLPDVTIEYGGGATGNVASETVLFQGDPPQIDVVRMSLSDSNQFTLNGNGQLLSGFKLSSAGGSLQPATSPAPFASLQENTANAIDYASVGSEVRIDGNVTLNSGWNRYVGLRDVWYEYSEQDGSASGPFRIPGSEYPIRPPATAIDVRVDQSAAGLPVVLSGQRHEVRNITFTSERGALRFDPAAVAPFETVGVATPNRVELATSTSVVIDGDVATNVFYNPDIGGQDIRAAYDLVGRNLPRVADIADYPSLSISATVSEAFGNPIVLHGTGQYVGAITFRSESGSLRPGTDPAPFDAFGESNSNAVNLNSNGFVQLDGSLTTDVQYDFAKNGRDISFEYTVSGSDEVREREITSYPLPPDRLIAELRNNGEMHEFVFSRRVSDPISSITFTSPSGSLLVGESEAFTFGEVSPTRVELVTDDPVRLSRNYQSGVGYNEFVAGEDVEISFTVPRIAGPVEGLVIGGYPSNPINEPLNLRVDSDLRLNLNGLKQPLTSIGIQSADGRLVYEDNGGPFTATNTEPTDVQLTLDAPLPVDGQIELPVSWIEGDPDLQFVYTLEGVDGRYGPFELGIFDYPRPQQISVIADPNFAGGVAISSREGTILGIEITSAAGSLTPGPEGDAGPFDSIEENSENRVFYSAPNGVSDQFFVLPVNWSGGEPDLEVTFTMLGRSAVASISYSAVVPEPATMPLALLMFISLFTLRASRRDEA